VSAPFLIALITCLSLLALGYVEMWHQCHINHLRDQYLHRKAFGLFESHRVG